MAEVFLLILITMHGVASAIVVKMPSPATCVEIRAMNPGSVCIERPKAKP